MKIRAVSAVLLIGLLAGLMFSRLTLETTEAQQTAQRTTERWEYCAITHVLPVVDGQRDISAAHICYFQRSGCRREVVKGSDNVDFTDKHLDALSKAAAKLGGEGWEMLGEGTQYAFNSATDRKALYFRRRQR